MVNKSPTHRLTSSPSAKGVESRDNKQIPTGLARGFHVQTRGRGTLPSLNREKMIYEWLMVICLYAYVASSLGKALPLWRLRRRAKISGTRAERDEATFAAYAATWSALAIAFAAFAAIVITSPDNQFVDVVRVEGALAPCASSSGPRAGARRRASPLRPPRRRSSRRRRPPRRSPRSWPPCRSRRVPSRRPCRGRRPGSPSSSPRCPAAKSQHILRAASS